MSAGDNIAGNAANTDVVRDRPSKRHLVLVSLTEEQLAAAEGWRLAHGIGDQASALGELIRLGLLNEVAKIYRLVADHRRDTRMDSRRASGRARASERED